MYVAKPASELKQQGDQVPTQLRQVACLVVEPCKVPSLYHIRYAKGGSSLTLSWKAYIMYMYKCILGQPLDFVSLLNNLGYSAYNKRGY